MSEKLPDSQPVLALRSNKDGIRRIEVWKTTSRVNEQGKRYIESQVPEEIDGEFGLVGKYVSEKALSAEVQAAMAHDLAMDRNPTPEQLEREPRVNDAVEDLGEQALSLVGVESPDAAKEAPVAIGEPSIAERMNARLSGSVVESEPAKPAEPEIQAEKGEVLTKTDVEEIVRQVSWTIDMSNGIKHNMHDAGPGSESRIRHDIQANIADAIHGNKGRLERGQISELAALLMNATAVGASPDRRYAHEKPLAELESTESINPDELAMIRQYVGSIDYLADNPSSSTEKLSLISHIQDTARNMRQNPSASKAYGLVLDALAAGFGAQILGNESYQVAQRYVNALHDELR